MTHQKLNILILEDEALVAMDLAETIESAGYGVLGPFSNCIEAEKSLSEVKPDYAILDVDLGRGETCFALAHLLKTNEIPFTFATGYDDAQSNLFQDFTDIPRLNKPYGFNEIKHQISTLLG